MMGNANAATKTLVLKTLTKVLYAIPNIIDVFAKWVTKNPVMEKASIVKMSYAPVLIFTYHL